MSIVLFSWNSILERRVCVNMIFCFPSVYIVGCASIPRKVSIFELGHDPSISTPEPAAHSPRGKIKITQKVPISQSSAQKPRGGYRNRRRRNKHQYYFIIQSAFLANTQSNKSLNALAPFMRVCNLLDYIMRCVLVISAVIYESAAVGALKARAPAWSFIQRGSSRKCLKGRVMSTAARALTLAALRERQHTHIQYISPLICPQVHPSTRPQCATFPLALPTPLVTDDSRHPQHQEVQCNEKIVHATAPRFCSRR